MRKHANLLAKSACFGCKLRQNAKESQMLTVAEMFKPGLGPSSSHTTGPMKAAYRFVALLSQEELLARTARVECVLYGSLALTGKGHHTDRAVVLGLGGKRPETIDAYAVDAMLDAVTASGRLSLMGSHEVAFSAHKDIVFDTGTNLPYHSNAMQFFAYDAADEHLLRRIYYSIGGGFVVDEIEAGRNELAEAHADFPCQFASASELVQLANDKGVHISEIQLENEEYRLGSREKVQAQLDQIWGWMETCIDRGMSREGILPGGLNVKRRAPRLAAKMEERENDPDRKCERSDWLNLWAMAVNEENASGGKVVTAPTNGAAGVIPAVIRYYLKFMPGANEQGVRCFLMTATAIGGLYKRNASISGAEVGCQGEVGVACSMAAAGLAAVMGGTNEQIENAAEIGMEHNLGMTCDPIGGLVQIPCIERNAFGAAMAVQAARLALLGDGEHYVSLDKAIQTMRDTGRDMNAKYKETSQGGLAVDVGVNVVEC